MHRLGLALSVDGEPLRTTTDLLKVPLYPLYFLMSLASILIGLEMLLMLAASGKLLLGRPAQTRGA